MLPTGSRGRHVLDALYVGVVMAVHFLDDGTNKSKTSIECDLIRAGDRMVFRNVPVLQQGGYDDQSVWIPRPTTQDLSGKSLQLTASNVADVFKITTLDDMDGDHVVFGFLESNPGTPVILGALRHPRSLTTVSRAEGWKRVVRHGGVEITLEQDGNVVIDIEDASTAKVTMQSGSDVIWRVGDSSDSLTWAVRYAELKAQIDSLAHAVWKHNHSAHGVQPTGSVSAPASINPTAPDFAGIKSASMEIR